MARRGARYIINPTTLIDFTPMRVDTNNRPACNPSRLHTPAVLFRIGPTNSSIHLMMENGIISAWSMATLAMLCSLSTERGEGADHTDWQNKRIFMEVSRT